MDELPAEDPVADRLRAAREAAGARDWPRAYELLGAVDAETPLAPSDLELLAKAAWWTGRANESIEARERAYAGHVAAGEMARAAFCALTLRREYTSRGMASPAQGWLARAARLLAELPESESHGYLAIAQAEADWHVGQFDSALARLDQALDLAGRFADPDLTAWARMRRGMILLDAGRVEEGWPLLEETGAAAVGGELGSYTTGAVFCNVIIVSRDMANYRQASEWADAARRWCERQEIAGFPGICRVRRAEVMRILGSWNESEAEIRLACEELAGFNQVYEAEAFHELGEVRRRRGDRAAAAQAFDRAAELGADPQPGRALLLLAEGEPDAAAASIRRSLESEHWNRLTRARLLPSQIEIARARGDLTTVRSAADELEAIATEFGTTALQAEAEEGAGTVALLEGDPVRAAERFRRARRLWQEVGAPFEAASAGLHLAEAYLAEGDRASAQLELTAARSTFERLGAEPSLARVDELLASTAPASRATRAVRTFLFTDVVGSTALVGVIGDEAWSDLRRWHDETLRTSFASHGGEEVDHAGDGFFVAFPDPASAVTCAVEIQRSLAGHRRQHGFAPGVRMGIHAAEATHDGRDYAGMGVHAAARIAAAAEAGEILASAGTVGDLEGVSVSGRRTIELKGFAEPQEVVAVGWASPAGSR